ncbi:MAG TPA: COX15/CtaA family protein [Verrucomicrobiaceae bacterium]
MTWTRFQRIAFAAFLCLEGLIFMGAMVRATGSGLGCPDWPFCYGCWIPPTNAASIDFSKLDLAKFREKAARLGEDPASITVETLRARFDSLETWIEYLNRVSSLPLFVALLAMLVASFRQPPRAMIGTSVTALVLFFMNAVIGALVVKSLLKPNNVTMHMALAILLQCVLVFAAWRGRERPWMMELNESAAGRLRLLAWMIFVMVVMEGIMGSQVRELTDDLARQHARQPRSAWTAQLEHSAVYLVHRSFSWILVAAGVAFAWLIRKSAGRLRWIESAIVSFIGIQMLLGLVLSQVGIVKLAQILHIGVSSLLVSAIFLWLLAARPALGHRGSGALPAIG